MASSVHYNSINVRREKMNSEVSNQIVDAVFKVLIDGSKQDYIGEKISQLEHSLQAAAQALESSNIFLLIYLFFYNYYSTYYLFYCY